MADKLARITTPEKVSTCYRWTLIADVCLALGLWVGAFGWVVWTAEDIGIGYDEPIYSGYAFRYLAWWRFLVDSWAVGRFFEPFRPEVIDLYWHAKDMHPPIPKLLAALGYWFIAPLLGSDLAGMRSGTAFLFGAMIAAIYWFGRDAFTRAGALFATFAVAFMPRLFADAHFLTMDMPVTATTVIGTLLLLRALGRPSLGRIVAACLGVGAAIASKANGFLILPAALLFSLTVVKGSDALGNANRLGTEKAKEPKGRWANWARVWHSLSPLFRQLTVLAVIGLGAIAFLFGTWLWLWVDPLPRFREYFTFHAKHFAVHTFYLGRLWEMAPWHYPLVMSLVTVPTLTLTMALVGAGWTMLRWHNAPSLAKLALLSYFVHIAPFLLPTTPKYNGIRLFEPAFPFLGILAGYTFGKLAKWLEGWLREKAAQRISSPKLVTLALGLLLLAPAAYSTFASHPFGLSYYNALVGGVRGAAFRWGFEVTYWGVNLLNIIPFLNRQPDGTRVLFLPGWALYPTVDFYRNAGVIRKGIITMGNPKDLNNADFLVFQASQTELELLQQEDPKLGNLLWTLWRKATPACAASYDGVVIVGVYDRATVQETFKRLSLPHP